MFKYLFPLFFGSLQKEGCRDINALNFDPEADNDDTYQYTKMIFHAPGDMVG